MCLRARTLTQTPHHKTIQHRAGPSPTPFTPPARATPLRTGPCSTGCVRVRVGGGWCLVSRTAVHRWISRLPSSFAFLRLALIQQYKHNTPYQRQNLILMMEPTTIGRLLCFGCDNRFHCRWIVTPYRRRIASDSPHLIPSLSRLAFPVGAVVGSFANKVRPSVGDCGCIVLYVSTGMRAHTHTHTQHPFYSPPPPSQLLPELVISVLLVLLLGLLAHRMIGKGVAMFKASKGDACLLMLGG